MNAPGGEKPPVCAVVVTHHPDPGWPGRFAIVAAESAVALVVDNGSSAAEVGMIEREVARHGARLIANPSNRGLAAALNQGARWAFAEGYAFVLAFDQDTEPLPGITDELLRVFQLADRESKTALVGSNFLDRDMQNPRFPTPTEVKGDWARRRTVIMSGSLIERSAFLAVGPFREEFFVDSVDHEYCLRSRRRGFQVVAARKPLMKHSFGLTTTHRCLGMSLATSNHPAGRRYSMARNRLVLAREYFFSEPRWVAAGVYALLKEVARILLVEDERAGKVRSIFLGAWHGMLGKPGPGRREAAN